LVGIWGLELLKGDIFTLGLAYKALGKQAPL
jgi:hypothetical protein